ncbi:MAG: ASPIC/UnbV domain-containing protein [Myxococcales bacterium]|nr:ASPIC/UnbV domain-containing protein [Myxococcales bacterium]
MPAGKGQPYVEAGYVMGLDFDHDGRAVAPLDMDGDGDRDLALLSLQGLQLMRNEAEAGAGWTRVRLRATKTHPLALGAVVTVTAGGRSQVDRLRLVEGFHTQHAPELHFGLGAAKAVERVEVRWPSGAVEQFGGVEPGRRNLLVEGAGVARAQAVPAWPGDAQPTVVGSPSLSVSAVWGDGVERPLGRVGQVTLVNVFAPWCEPCKTEMPHLAALAKRRSDVAVVAVSVGRDDLQASLDFAAAHGPGLPVAFANDRVVGAFFGGNARIPLPSTFVFDHTGRLRRAFQRPVDAETLADAVASTATPAVVTDYRYLLRQLLREKRHAEAQALLDEAVRRVPDDASARVWLAEMYLSVGQPDGARAQLEAALEKAPGDARALATLAEVVGVGGDLVRAEALLLRALEVAPRELGALNNLGMVYLKSKRHAEAADMFRRALDVEPHNPRVQQNLRDALEAQGLAPP